jgi:hypothetical protein
MKFKDEEDMRPCLGHECQKTGKKFLSSHKGHRFCEKCNKKRIANSTGEFLHSRGFRIPPKEVLA